MNTLRDNVLPDVWASLSPVKSIQKINHHCPLGLTAAAAAKLLQSCPTPCDPIDGSPSGSTVHGIFQARVLEWGAIAFSAPWP